MIPLPDALRKAKINPIRTFPGRQLSTASRGLAAGGPRLSPRTHPRCTAIGDQPRTHSCAAASSAPGVCSAYSVPVPWCTRVGQGGVGVAGLRGVGGRGHLDAPGTCGPRSVAWNRPWGVNCLSRKGRCGCNPGPVEVVLAPLRPHDPVVGRAHRDLRPARCAGPPPRGVCRQPRGAARGRNRPGCPTSPMTPARTPSSGATAPCSCRPRADARHGLPHRRHDPAGQPGDGGSGRPCPDGCAGATYSTCCAPAPQGRRTGSPRPCAWATAPATRSRSARLPRAQPSATAS
jgi:hypothetical protein